MKTSNVISGFLALVPGTPHASPSLHYVCCLEHPRSPGTSLGKLISKCQAGFVESQTSNWMSLIIIVRRRFRPLATTWAIVAASMLAHQIQGACGETKGQSPDPRTVREKRWESLLHQAGEPKGCLSLKRASRVSLLSPEKRSASRSP